MACNEAIDFMARHPGSLTAWVAPTYRQSKIAYRLIKKALTGVLSYKSDAELRLELPNGATIMFCSSENYDALRGNGIHFLIIDECADVNEKAWIDALRPTLADTNGKALFIGTPKGRNFFFTLFMRGQDPAFPDWASFTAPSSANPYIPKGEIEAARREMPEDSFRQEFLAVFLEESAGVFRGIDNCIVGEAEDWDEPIDGHMYTLGWDPAKYQDYSVVTVLDASTMSVAYWFRTNQVDYTAQIQEVLRIAKEYDAYVLMDMTGVGSPLLERLQQSGDVNVQGYLFTNASKKVLIETLQLGIQHRALTFPDIPVLINELRQYQYEITPSRNVTYNAPVGAHDDAVISLALAYYAADKPKIPLSGDEVVETSVQVPTIKEIVEYDPFDWASEHNVWGYDD